MWETNMITPLCFSDNKKRRKERRERGEQKEEVLCDGFVEYKPRVRGAAVMKRQRKKKFGRERKKQKGRRGRVRTKGETQKVVRKAKWEEGGVGAQ